MATYTVCVVGLGTVGMPTAEYIASRGLDVYGYDIAERKGPIKSTTRWDEIPHSEVDAYVIAVYVGVQDAKLGWSPLHDVCMKISEANPDALVSVESTVPVGTCRSVARRFGLNRLIHVPHRYWVEDPVRHGVRQLRVIGALNEESMEMGLKLYRDLLDIPLHPVSSLEVAEACKILENAYRFVQIAFAEEMKMICHKVGLDFEEVKKACNTKWNIHILEARRGIERGCLPKDIRFALMMDESARILRAAIEADEAYKRWLSTVS